MQKLSEVVNKFVGRANPITDFDFVEEYVKNTKYIYNIFLAYPIPNLDFVSHTKINCELSDILNYEEDYDSISDWLSDDNLLS
jgi:hypothetical protein